MNFKIKTSNFKPMRPDLSRVGSFYHNYIGLVTEDELSEAFDKQSASFIHFLDTIPANKYDYRYADGKWTIKEVLSHLIDGERIFAYRMLRISRGDETPIEGFEQDGYIENSNANNRSFADLLDEFELSRRANVLFLNNLDEAGLARIHARMSELLAREGARVDAIYFCQHHPSEGVGLLRRECA